GYGRLGSFGRSNAAHFSADRGPDRTGGQHRMLRAFASSRRQTAGRTRQSGRLPAAQTGLAANIVCCGHSLLSDGKLLAVGGGGLNPGSPTSIQAWKFDPMAQTWTRTAGNMSQQRWYPTAMTMADEGATPNTGRVLIASGGSGDPIMEVYSEATDNFTPV